MLPVSLKNSFSLSVLTEADKPDLVRNINDPEIYRATLNIPHPYREQDADYFLKLVEEQTAINGGVTTSLCIRSPRGEVIGGVGFDGLKIGTTHRAEIGYWLAKSYWGASIMTGAVATACNIGFEQFGLEKITAHIFAFNAASQRVLEKNGFHLEGELLRHYQKGGEFFDAKLFAKVK